MDTLVKQVQALTSAVNQLTLTVNSQQAQLDQLTTVVQSLQTPVHPSPSPPVEPKMPLPERFTGDRSDFRNFANRCQSYFLMRPVASGTELQRITLLKTLLHGDSQTWAYNLPEGHEALTSVQKFFEAMAVIYDDPDVAATAERKLKALKQGQNSVENYAAEFRRWSFSTRWEAYSLLDRFLSGLSETVSELMLSHPEPRSLDEAISLAIKIDRRVRYHKSRSSRPSRAVSSTVTVPISAGDEPMQLGHFKLSESEKARRRKEGLCMYCGEKGHVVSGCSKKSGNSFA